MKYNPEKKEIISNKKLNNLDKLVLKFIEMIKKYTDYVIISGYISILLGRTRATEDIGLFIKKISKEKFSKLYNELKKEGFWCLNAESVDDIYSYLENEYAVRFARKGESVPNFEVKFPKREVDEQTFQDFIRVKLNKEQIKISSLERHIAFKRYFLKSEKDLEDALHVEELFKDKLDYKKINKLKKQVKKI